MLYVNYLSIKLGKKVAGILRKKAYIGNEIETVFPSIMLGPINDFDWPTTQIWKDKLSTLLLWEIKILDSLKILFAINKFCQH